MKLLIDMNLSADWVPLFIACGWTARHWRDVGRGNAPDTDLLRWARDHAHVLVTQDLDFAQLLFTTRDRGPSVVLLRLKDEFNKAARQRVIEAISQAQEALSSGALLTLSDAKIRLRRLPIIPT